MRRDFPALSRCEGGAPLAYLDSASTTQKPRQVVAALAEFYARGYANVHRGVYPLAVEATAAFEAARDRVARLAGAHDRAGVVFTRNCTEALNLVAHAWARPRLRPGDRVVTTLLEHHSNFLPWQQAAAATGAELAMLPLTAELTIDHARLDEVIDARTRVVAVTGMSNVLGAAVDLDPIVRAAHGVGAVVVVDASQLAMHGPLDAGSLGLDFVALSGHKLLGPSGVGALCARPELLEQMEPLYSGGEMVLDVGPDHVPVWNEIPYRFEAGTPMIAEAVGLGAALDYLEALGAGWIRRRDRELFERGLELLRGVEGLVLYGGTGPAGRAPTFAFNLLDDRGQLVHPHDVGTIVADQGVAIRVGHHCARPLMRHLGVPATCRASAYVYNTEQELERLADALRRARSLFCRG